MFKYSSQWNMIDSKDLLCPNVHGEMEHVLYHLHNGIALNIEESDDEEDNQEELSEEEEEQREVMLMLFW